MIIHDEKQEIRNKVWRLLEREGASPSDSYGKIPSFVGAEKTAEALARTDPWRAASVIKANPDHPQFSVRSRALRDGKLLYMAVPRMAGIRPFYKLDPDALGLPIDEAADKSGAAKIGNRVSIEEMQPIDLVVCGSVAVNRLGARIGKGAGYSDLEVSLLIEAGLVTDKTTIVAPVHHLQLIDEEIPETEHDFRVDLIVTPHEVISCPSTYRPRGIVWEHLTRGMIEAIPVLAAQEERRRNKPQPE